MEQYMAKIEELLVKQEQQNKKLRKTQRLQGFVLIIMLVVFAVGMFYIGWNLKEATEGLPELIATANDSISTTSGELQGVLKEINEIDFEALNNSIKSLESVTTKLANVFK